MSKFESLKLTSCVLCADEFVARAFQKIRPASSQIKSVPRVLAL